MPLEHPSDPGETTVESLSDMARNVWTILYTDALKNTWSKDLAEIPRSAVVHIVENMRDEIQLLLDNSPSQKDGHQKMLRVILQALQDRSSYALALIMATVSEQLEAALSNEQHIRPYLRALERNGYITIDNGLEEQDEKEELA